MNRQSNIQRECFYIPSGTALLFGWLHRTGSEKVPAAAVICNPLGVEYMSGHRSIRHLADQLANSGIPAMRFDYAVAGDSTGGDFAETRVNQFVTDIESAVAAVRTMTGCTQIAIIGIGLGATFAAMAAQSCARSHLVLWNPTVSGKRFVREQKLMSDVLGAASSPESGIIDSAGILLSKDLQADFQQIDISKLGYNNISSVMLINRSDLKPNRKLQQAIIDGGGKFREASLPGYKEMMNNPTDTVVPFEVFAEISAWLNSQSADADTHPLNAAENRSNQLTKVATITGGPGAPVVEKPVEFGESNHLFGIVSLPENLSDNDTSRRAFVFLNCGSEHHAGPHRMYTSLARLLSGTGHIAFRFDIEGIGDSISIGNNTDNNAYSPAALHDIEHALTMLAERFGATEFILNGICAGAYHSFRGLAQLDRFNIPEGNLINPLVFEWDYENPDNVFHFETHTYKGSVRDASKWIRLIKGDVDYRRLIRSLSASVVKKAESLSSRILNFVLRRPKTGLPADIETIAEQGRKMNLILADNDPGLDLMKLFARAETEEAIRAGWLTVQTIPDANHGLSKRHMQQRLIEIFVERYNLDS